MKKTGIVRAIDELGRIVLPKELRQVMNIHEKDALEIFAEDGKIVLKKYEPACIFCGSAENITLFCEKRVCRTCIEKLQEQK